MTTLTMDCGSELAVALGKRESEVAKEIKLASALKLFEMGRISSGLAAKLAGMDRVSFLLLCGQYGVSIFQQNEEEMVSDIKAIENVL
ncbi:MAG: UPF0175 family protein [Bacteroidia bacterium]|nr:UPF0175 family protein [Bacteroidia bacterium]